jgi:hypothetical protein
MVPPAVSPPPQPAELPPVPLSDLGYREAGPDDDTAPIPVILRGSDPGGRETANQTPSPPAAMRMRGPFEPPGRADPPATNGSAVSQAPPVLPAANGLPASTSTATSGASQGHASVWEPASSPMDQIKDLYLTAEAIGEDALDKHFQLVSDRQRQLIREYFHQVIPSPADGQDQP